MRPIEAASELEKAMSHRPGVPANVVMEELAEQLGHLGEVAPPVDMHLLASLQSVAEICETVSTHSGCLINRAGRLRIELCATDNPQRQRFTIGHEICHTLLPGFTMTQNFRCNPGGSTPPTTDRLNIEWLADVGASELLLPRRFVRDDFASRALGWDAIEQVASLYNASLEATARRYVRLSTQPAFFVRLEFAPSRTDLTPKLRVRSASWSPGMNVFIPRNKSLPVNHPIHQAAHGEFVDTNADMSTLQLPSAFTVSARPYPYSDHQGETVMRVLALGQQSSSPALTTP